MEVEVAWGSMTVLVLVQEPEAEEAAVPELMWAAVQDALGVVLGLFVAAAGVVTGELKLEKLEGVVAGAEE